MNLVLETSIYLSLVLTPVGNTASSWSLMLGCSLLGAFISVEEFVKLYAFYRASQVALVVMNPPASAGGIRDADSIPGLGRSPGGGHGNLL